MTVGSSGGVKMPAPLLPDSNDWNNAFRNATLGITHMTIDKANDAKKAREKAANAAAKQAAEVQRQMGVRKDRDAAVQARDESLQRQRLNQAQSQGRGSTILTGYLGETATPSGGKKLIGA